MRRGPVVLRPFPKPAAIKSLGPWGRNLTANLTPAPETYLGRATKAEFIGRFRAFANINATNAPAAPPAATRSCRGWPSQG